MTSSHTESPSYISASSRQTRFYIAEDSASKEIDLKGVNVSIVTKQDLETSGKSRVKEKQDTLEILNDAHLRLKTGIHYALVGRNGTGKSTLLRAIADKLIPGLPSNFRIAILQQTADEALPVSSGVLNRTVLETVIEGDPYRNRLLEDVKVLSQGTESKDPVAPVAAFRKIKHEELLREFKEVEQMARLRSGARGFDARKVLLTYEKKVQDSEENVKAVNENLPNDELERDTTGAVDLLGRLQSELETMKLEDVSEKARSALFGLGFSKSQFTKPFSSLSGGWKMRCLLAAAIVQTSDVLILDEPTNFLDLLGILWLQKFLRDLKEDSPLVTVVLVSHDRDFVNAITEETIILREKTLTYYPGNIASYDKSIHREILRTTRMKAAVDKQVAHMQQTIINNKKAYKKTGDESKSRQAKSRQKRLEDRTGMNVSAKGTRFKLNRDMPGYSADGMRKAIEIPKLELEVELKFPAAPELRFPGALISLEKVDLKYVKAPEPTLKQVDIVIHRGDRVGILGLNGAGKSTLIKVLMDTYKPTRGTVNRHPRLAVSYYSQDAVDVLKTKAIANTSWTALSFIHKCATDAGTELSEQEVRGLLAGLGLAGRTVSDVPLCKLSGGQMVRVELARIFLARPHMLVLDEPTTHLDLPTVHALMMALIAFDGAVVLVSHDRALIRCVVEGDPVHEPGSSDEDDESEDEEERMEKIAGVGRFVYELKGGQLTEVQGGVAAWEARVEKKLSKLGEGG